MKIVANSTMPLLFCQHGTTVLSMLTTVSQKSFETSTYVHLKYKRYNVTHNISHFSGWFQLLLGVVRCNGAGFVVNEWMQIVANSMLTPTLLSTWGHSAINVNLHHKHKVSIKSAHYDV